uniref:Nucleoside diphosphate kinase n=1 Tax=Physcomitrium patens TaxID=3218 RepID=A9SFM7_PHYPA
MVPDRLPLIILLLRFVVKVIPFVVSGEADPQWTLHSHVKSTFCSESSCREVDNCYKGEKQEGGMATAVASNPPQCKVGEIISKFERKGFQIIGLKLFRPPKELVEALEGSSVVAAARKFIGATNPLKAEPGTIRGDFAIDVGRNVVHGSDSPENGFQELGELFSYVSCPTLSHVF